MKRSEIHIGGTYTNGKGRIRRVVDIGPQYKFYNQQDSSDNLRYEIINDGTKENRTKGQQSNMTAAFASWSKAEIIPAPTG